MKTYRKINLDEFGYPHYGVSELQAAREAYKAFEETCPELGRIVDRISKKYFHKHESEGLSLNQTRILMKYEMVERIKKDITEPFRRAFIDKIRQVYSKADHEYEENFQEENKEIREELEELKRNKVKDDLVNYIKGYLDAKAEEDDG